jgi:hypothetical protein
MGLDSYLMSRLTDKYQSYSHFKGISFDEATFTAVPAKTGSRLYNGAAVFMDDTTSDGASSPTIQTGVMPDQKYYQFEFNTTAPVKNARIIYGNTSSGTAGGVDDIRRVMWQESTLDRVTGLWIKTPSSIAAMATPTVLAAQRWVYGAQPMFNVAFAKSPAGNPAIAVVHSTTEITPASTLYYESYTDANSNVIPIQLDTWYFVAIRKNMSSTDTPSIGGAMTGSLTYEYFINGEFVGSINRTSWTKRSVSGIIFGNNSALATYNLGLSSWFVTDWSAIGQTELREIYNYGAPIQAPVKHYNGTAWVDDASAPKVYYNGAWRDVYASRWTGSAWVPL